MVIQSCHPSSLKWRQEDQQSSLVNGKVKASSGYTRPWINKTLSWWICRGKVAQRPLELEPDNVIQLIIHSGWFIPSLSKGKAIETLASLKDHKMNADTPSLSPGADSVRWQGCDRHTLNGQGNAATISAGCYHTPGPTWASGLPGSLTAGGKRGSNRREHV